MANSSTRRRTTRSQKKNTRALRPRKELQTFLPPGRGTDSNESNCWLDNQYASDFDLDGTQDGDIVDCEGIPALGLAAYVTDTDWLEDLVLAADPQGCTGTLVNRGTQYDWLRYFWDMIEVETISATAMVDEWDYANPKSWDATGSTPDTADDPINRIQTAALNLSIEGYHNTHKVNGQDH